MAHPKSESPSPPPPPADDTPAPPTPEESVLADVFGAEGEWDLQDLAMDTFRNVMKGEGGS